MEIIEYTPKYKQDFIKFNTDWIVDNFGFLEDEDLETFEKIDEHLANGAMIYIAVENETALAVCMAMPMKNGTWEICKLASNKLVFHKGAGSTVFKAAMDWAINHGAERLFLLSNSKLKPALHIYKKFGFKEIKLNDYEYIRGDIAFEYIVNEKNPWEEIKLSDYENHKDEY
jgi:N-acetylglutamate synthase-like GNAT family acetyltransferase